MLKTSRDETTPLSFILCQPAAAQLKLQCLSFIINRINATHRHPIPILSLSQSHPSHIMSTSDPVTPESQPVANCHTAREGNPQIEKAGSIQPSEAAKSMARTLLAGVLVPIACALPELMVVKKQLRLYGDNGLAPIQKVTSTYSFLSGASMGWISGGFKAAIYTNKDLVCSKISKIRNNNSQKNASYNVIDRTLASVICGGVDAVVTHVPSSIRALTWTNPSAINTLYAMPYWESLKSIYKVGFTARMLKTNVNAGCYISLMAWVEEKVKVAFPGSLDKSLSVLTSGLCSGIICTAIDVTSAHIYQKAVFSENQVKAHSLFKLGSALYKQNGLRIFVSGAPWHVLVSTLAFGTMASVESFVDSELFAKTYKENGRFFKSLLSQRSDDSAPRTIVDTQKENPSSNK